MTPRAELERLICSLFYADVAKPDITFQVLKCIEEDLYTLGGFVFGAEQEEIATAVIRLNHRVSAAAELLEKLSKLPQEDEKRGVS